MLRKFKFLTLIAALLFGLAGFSYAQETTGSIEELLKIVPGL